MVSTLDFESSDPSSNLGGTYVFKLQGIVGRLPGVGSYLNSFVGQDKVRSKFTNLLDMSMTSSWKYLHMLTHSSLRSSSNSTSARNFLATISKASSGHAYHNNSIQNYSSSLRVNNYTSTY